MCFSAEASFGAGIVLSTIGIVTLKKAKHKSQLAFAGIPLIFSVQQISEGFLWLSLSNPDYAHLQNLTTYTFLFFAQVVWPFWVPFSIMLAEKKNKRTRLQKFILTLGIIDAAYLAYCLMTFDVEGKIVGQHIAYLQDYPQDLGMISGILYMIATVGSPLFSKIRFMWILSVTVFISYLITLTFYTDYIVSVWCFFASIISITVLWILVKMKSKTEHTF